MTEILAVWFGVMIVILALLGLSCVVFLMINVFFKYIEKANYERSLLKKIGFYSISFSMFSLFVLMIVTFAMI